VRLQPSAETVSVRVKELGEKHESAEEPENGHSKRKHKEHKHDRKQHKHDKDRLLDPCITLAEPITSSAPAPLNSSAGNTDICAHWLVNGQ
jgi:hypothetical protein